MSQESMYEDRKDVMPLVHNFSTPPPLQQLQPSHHNRGEHGEQQQLECFSDEVDSRGNAEQQKDPGTLVVVSSGGVGDGASIEVAKKRRGRPPGSKNRPKPPVVITRETEPAAAMRTHVIEIPCGRDVAQALARFAARRNLGICVLGGTGAVANVSLRHPAPAGVLHAGGHAQGGFVFRGQYEILSISATFLPPAMSAVAPQAALAAAGVSISLAGPHGQIIGGAVAGPLYAATTVVVVAAAFTNPTFHRLPADDDAAVSVSVSVSAGSADQQADHHQQQQHAEPTTQKHHRNVVRRQATPHLAAQVSAPQPVESCGPMPIYACHPQPQDVMWPPPPARGPLPQPPPF